MFKLDSQYNLNANFEKWFEQNQLEREQWGDTILTREEAFELFLDIFKSEVDNLPTS